MLIPYYDIQQVLTSYNIHPNGALHIGAHDCEELSFYKQLSISSEKVVWIDALPDKVQQAKARGIPNVYHAVVTDQDDQEVMFHVSNNGQSSSVLEFGTHAQEHPSIVYTHMLRQQSVTIDTFSKRNNIDLSTHDFWNFDIQGAELMALKGAVQSLPYAKALYLEVNVKELYQGCGLMTEIDQFLAPYRFKRVLTNMTSHGWGDALYVFDSSMT